MNTKTQRPSFRSQDIAGAQFARADLAEAILTDANASRASFYEAKIAQDLRRELKQHSILLEDRVPAIPGYCGEALRSRPHTS